MSPATSSQSRCSAVGLVEEGVAQQVSVPRRERLEVGDQRPGETVCGKDVHAAAEDEGRHHVVERLENAADPGTDPLHSRWSPAPGAADSPRRSGTDRSAPPSSIAAQNLFPTFAVHSGTKAYVTHLSRTLRAELGAKDVRVCAIEPGIVGTELQNHVTDAGALEWLGVRNRR